MTRAGTPAAATPATRSEALFERLARVMPGANTRTATHYAPYPVALAEGAGCRVRDVDGREYLDFLNNYTALVHGHAHPVITAALVDAARRGTAFPAPLACQVELAERIGRRFPSIAQVRFCNSGTEAVMMAVRAARAFTGRDRIVKAIGGYHGSWEQVAMGAGEDDAAPGGAAARQDRGIPRAVRDLALQVPYNDVPALEAAMAAAGREVAAILLEPVLGHLVIPATAEYLRAARRLADAHGALLVLDEVVTARLHEGGCQGRLGVRADLTTLGKIIGGGLPVGAFGGRADVMALFDPRNDDAVPHHGTYNGSALAMVAGAVSLDLLPQAEIDRIDGLGARLAAGVAAGLAEGRLEGHVTRAGSILHVHAPRMAELHRACLAEGLYVAPRGQLSVSTPMDGTVVDEAVERFARAAGRLRA